MNLTKDDTARILLDLGYAVDRNFKFKIRNEENTASASINPKDGKIKDFGSGWYGDIVDFLVHYHSMSKKEAFEKTNGYLGKDNFANQPISFTKSSSQKQNKQPFIEQKYIDNFAQERKNNFKRYSELLTQALPTLTPIERKKIAQEYEIGYSKKADRLIMPIRDINGNCVTFWKYNKNPTPFKTDTGELITLPKLMFSKGRGRIAFNTAKLKEYSQKKDEILFIFEGEKDCLNAIANNLHAITLGSASSNLDKKLLPFFKDKNICISYDFDEAGKNGATQLKEQLKGYCKSIEIIDWKQIARKTGLEKYLKKGFDYTDYLQAIKNIERQKIISKAKIRE